MVGARPCTHSSRTLIPRISQTGKYDHTFLLAALGAFSHSVALCSFNKFLISIRFSPTKIFFSFRDISLVLS
jgi:hypothetical protein